MPGDTFVSITRACAPSQIKSIRPKSRRPYARYTSKPARSISARIAWASASFEDRDSLRTGA